MGSNLALWALSFLVLSSCGGASSTLPPTPSSSLFTMNRSPSSYLESGKNVIVNTTVEWQTPSVSLELSPDNQQTPVWHFKGSIYLVWVDPGFRPWLTKISNGIADTAPLDPQGDYIAQPDGHHRFSLGIDRNGYLHITGDMHNYTNQTTGVIRPYPLRYQKQTILYWKSNQPESVAGGFTFVGGNGDVRAIPGAGWTYGRFFTDNHGVLYYSSRVKAIVAGHLPGEMGLGLYKYDVVSATWIALGGLADQIRPGIYHKVLLWENAGMAPGKWYQGFLTSLKFDYSNRLHFAATINTDTALSGNNRLVYAVSNDGGMTWNKANGSKIPGVPIRAVDEAPNRGDIVAETPVLPFFDSRVDVLADKNGKPGIAVGSSWYTWVGNSWTTNNVLNSSGTRATSGNLNPDNELVLTVGGSSKLLRTESFDDRIYGHDLSSYKTYQCVNGLGLQTTGAIYGIGIKDNIQSVLKTTVIPAPLPCGWSNKDIAPTLPGYGGTAGYLNGQFVVTSYGTALDNSYDSFHYVHKQMSGDGTITARVNTTTPSGHTRAGVMMRETLAFNSKHAMATIAPASKGAIFGYRKTMGGGTINTALAGISVPYWIKLVRSEDTFTGFISKDGITWTQTGKVSIPMSKTIYVGLASASYHSYGMQTATFENVHAPAFQMSDQACNY